MACLPFFMVTSFGSFISLFFLHFTQYASAIFCSFHRKNYQIGCVYRPRFVATGRNTFVSITLIIRLLAMERIRSTSFIPHLGRYCCPEVPKVTNIYHHMGKCPTLAFPSTLGSAG